LVDAETRKKFDIEESEPVDYSKQDLFSYRTTAIRLVKEQMSVGEREELVARVLQYKGKGLPPEIQRQYAAIPLDVLLIIVINIRYNTVPRRAVPSIL